MQREAEDSEGKKIQHRGRKEDTRRESNNGKVLSVGER